MKQRIRRSCQCGCANTRHFGCPEWIFLDDPEKVHHYLGRSVKTLLRWEERGLRIRSRKIGGREFRYIFTEEFLAFLELRPALAVLKRKAA